MGGSIFFFFFIDGVGIVLAYFIDNMFVDPHDEVEDNKNDIDKEYY